ncbi:hypothetical protein F9C07_1581205 [Aspergillus flavus]|uniref:Uncharacterized protein n=1 Tax=Aspergillus flavus (strain ATCC 200026 / FGSC A1120 / IAM 13836 / NRRL 3357 / JCM 12722 / SRRC 167) TaxID=332952 RepID=A0A7U2MVZ6_ASPFN|nr:hypothetical protein AFLA_011876 [Aspergillus flavus NRRL3357]QRD90575.1 hypothetical protein F9C07_1581205 [Aspergillus flavus]
MSTPANKKRASERLKCRKELSNHLKNTLSLLVPPSEIRLHPQAGDEYMWQCNNNCKHLFSKNLSDLSTNNYIEIYSALENGDIWAVENNITANEMQGKQAQEVGRLREEYEKLKLEHFHLQKKNKQLTMLLLLHNRRSDWLGQSLAKAEIQSRTLAGILEQLKQGLNNNLPHA